MCAGRHAAFERVGRREAAQRKLALSVCLCRAATARGGGQLAARGWREAENEATWLAIVEKADGSMARLGAVRKFAIVRRAG